MIYAYWISCEDSRAFVLSDNKIPNFHGEVIKTIRGMDRDEIVEPKDDWHLAIVQAVCKRLGCYIPETEEAEVEDAYCEEVRRREDGGVSITDAMRDAAAGALGYEVDDESIDRITKAYNEEDQAPLEDVLMELVERFDSQGGRGVDLADEIDSLRVWLAVRDLIPKPSV